MCSNIWIRIYSVPVTFCEDFPPHCGLRNGFKLSILLIAHLNCTFSCFWGTSQMSQFNIWYFWIPESFYVFTEPPIPLLHPTLWFHSESHNRSNFFLCVIQTTCVCVWMCVCARVCICVQNLETIAAQDAHAELSQFCAASANLNFNQLFAHNITQYVCAFESVCVCARA